MSNDVATADKVTSKHKYIFPNFMAKAMANVDPKTQYESAMLSSALILFGIVATSIMMIFFMDLTITYKVLIAINCLGGFIYISSSLVTVYQQYANYCDIMEIQKSFAQQVNPSMIKTIEPKIKKNRINQVIFGLGLLFIAAGIAMFFTSLEIYYGVAVIVAGVAMIVFVIKKGQDGLKKKILIEKLIREGKLKPKNVPLAQAIQKQTISEKPNVNLVGRLRGLMAGIKIAKIKKEKEKEDIIRAKLQNTLDEIKRLKLSERRSQI